MLNLYETIASLCSDKGITITEMCSSCGASRGSLSDLKMGRKKTLSVETLSKIATYFNIPIKFLTKEAPFDKWDYIKDDRLSVLNTMWLDNASLYKLTKIADINSLSLTEYINFIDTAVESIEVVDNKVNIKTKGWVKIKSGMKNAMKENNDTDDDISSDARRLELANKLIDVYMEGVKYWSEDKFFSSSETISIKEHFADLLLKYKTVINYLADAKSGYEKYRSRYLKYAEKSGKAITEVEIKQRFFENAAKRQIKDLDTWVRTLPGYIARKS